MPVMLDARMRRRLQPALAAAARRLHRVGVGPNALTVVGFLVGVAACVAAGLARWPLALVLWLANRFIDGLDGPVARLGGETDAGGFLDILADFAIYGGFVLGVAVSVPEARLACVALLVTYYVNGTAFLALSSLGERRRHERGDERSFQFVGGLAEGTETIIVHSLFCLLPRFAAQIAWAFAAIVAFTAGQRVVFALRALHEPAP